MTQEHKCYRNTDKQDIRQGFFGKKGKYRILVPA